MNDDNDVLVQYTVVTGFKSNNFSWCVTYGNSDSQNIYVPMASSQTFVIMQCSTNSLNQIQVKAPMDDRTFHIWISKSPKSSSATSSGDRKNFLLLQETDA